jgi:tRNA modification GTPase
MLTDTIAAIATPIGEGGLAIVRLSGGKSIPIAATLFRRGTQKAVELAAVKSHTVTYGHIVEAGQVLDEVLVTLMRAPRSFTGEDVVEISCHGGILPSKLILEAVLRAGARLSEPGEFSKRAFLNGRIDLTQAEAITDIIQSRTERALAAANEQLAGKLSVKINTLRDSLLSVLAHIEAHIDFPEEDIAPDTRRQLLERIEAALQAIDVILRNAREGQILRRGIRAAIVGRPNAGKSSLLNHLLGHDRAIVSAIPGTTRDTIEEMANIRGIPVVFIDTAGMRESHDLIEKEGIRRSHEAAQNAELILHVVDATDDPSSQDRELLDLMREKSRIVVVNKIDLAPSVDFSVFPSPICAISCNTGEGLEELKETIARVVWRGDVQTAGQGAVINARHQNALERAREALRQTKEALAADLSLELVAMDLRIGVNAVGEIVGKTSSEDLLDSIFSQFCIGK